MFLCMVARTKKHRPSRTPRPTPKGEAETGLQDAEAHLHELRQITNPNQERTFVRRLNDFLRSARVVENYLEREAGHAGGLQAWVRKEHLNLRASNPRYNYFVDLRNVSEKDCVVELDVGDISVDISDARLERGPAAALASAYDFGSPGAENAVQATRVTIKYSFKDWHEDVLIFCEQVTKTLRDLVTQAYQMFP